MPHMTSHAQVQQAMCCSFTYLTQFSCPPKANTASRMATKICGILSRVTGATRCVLASSLSASVVHSWTAVTTRAHTIAAVPRIDAVDMSCTFLTFTRSTPVRRCEAPVLLCSRATLAGLLAFASGSLQASRHVQKDMSQVKAHYFNIILGVR